MWSPHPYRLCTILRRIVVSILWHYEIGYRFNSSYFNFGQDWIFKRARAGASPAGRPAAHARITGTVCVCVCVTRRSECAKQRARNSSAVFQTARRWRRRGEEAAAAQDARTDGRTDFQYAQDLFHATERTVFCLSVPRWVWIHWFLSRFSSMTKSLPV